MKELFLKLLNSSISAGWLVLAILLLRVLLKRSPRRLICALWALVAIRLLCPISMESELSLIPAARPLDQEVFQQISESLFAVAPAAGVNPADSVGATPSPIFDVPDAPASGAELLSIVSAIWVIGIAAMAGYAIACSISMKKRLAASLCIRSNVYSCDYIDSPFIFGIANPKIYLPSCLTGEELPYVLAHENTHLQRRDHLWKPLGFLILSVYWFHPVMWIAFKVFCRDMELACDEQVIQKLDTSGKAAYSRTLLHYSGLGIAAVGPLAFGEKDVKHRINSILRYQPCAVWLTGIGILASIVLAVCFLTNPVQAAAFDRENQDTSGKTVSLLFIGQNEHPDSETKSADSILLASINCERKTLTLTSFAPDISLDLPDYMDSNGNAHVTGIHNMALCYSLGFAWGGDLGAMEMLSQCITENFGTEIDGAIALRSEAFTRIADAIGGIDVELDQDERDFLVENGFLPEGSDVGKHHLTGDAALSYCCIPGDDAAVQIERQQAAVQRIVQKCQRLSEEQLNQLLDAILPFTFTNLDEAALDAYRQQLLPLFSSLKMELRQCLEAEAAAS